MTGSPIADGFAAIDSLAEEIASSVTHGLAAALAVAGLVAMIWWAVAAQDVLALVCVSVFGASMILLYTASTLYHAIPHPTAKEVLRAVDHAAIYLLIAGTYTPFALVGLGGFLGWALFGVVWTLAGLGIGHKLWAMIRGSHSTRTSLILYLCLGWLAVLVIGQVYGALGPAGFGWVLAGGLMYSLGVPFYVWHALPFNHAVWHLFVMAGSACHFIAVAGYVLA